MDNQRIRNLTTCRLHTKIEDVYLDLEFLTGEAGVMTHMIPRMCRALTPWLNRKVADVRFWDGEYDPSHLGETELLPMDAAAKESFIYRYTEMPNPLLDKITPAP